MQIIVIGAGEVGFDVARMLAREQHDVIVLDKSAAALSEVSDQLDVMTMEGSGTAAEMLLECGVREADMLVAVTAIDEVNLVSCMMADRMGVETTVARVRSDEFTHSKSVLSEQDFGLDLVINPEESAATEVIRLIKRVSATNVLAFADGQMQLMGVRVNDNSPALGTTMRELQEARSGTPFRIMGIVRRERTVLPRGDESIEQDDQLFLLGQPSDLPQVAGALGESDAAIEEIMLLGGSPVGARIARRLSGDGERRVKLVEPDEDRCRELAEDLEDVLVINGDPTDIDLLATEGMGEMDAFVAVTRDQESNLVTCLMAKHLGVRKTVALLSKGAYIPISQTIGLDAAVSKKLAVAREVLRFVRGKNVRSVATVHGLDAEILEIEAAEGAPVTQGTLQEIDLPDGVLMGAVQSNDHVEVATGDTRIEPGSRAIVFALPEHVSDAQHYFDA
jgi:trk system potassium uptake protein TrkA